MDPDKTQTSLDAAGATLTIPLTGDTFTEEALASLVGQRPRVTISGDWTRPLGRATVVAAEEKDGSLILTLDYDEHAAAAVRDMVTGPVSGGYSIAPDPYPGGIGFQIPDAELLDPVKGLRRFKAIRLHEVHPTPEAAIEAEDEQ